MTCGRSLGVVILTQRASSPPLIPTRSRNGLTDGAGLAGSPVDAFRSARRRMVAVCASGVRAFAASRSADLLSSRPVSTAASCASSDSDAV
jgi:hypothetical protein